MKRDAHLTGDLQVRKTYRTAEGLAVAITHYSESIKAYVGYVVGSKGDGDLFRKDGTHLGHGVGGEPNPKMDLVMEEQMVELLDPAIKHAKAPEPTGKPHIHAKEIKAWAEGAVIQTSGDGEKWEHDPNPTWDIARKYRVRPQLTKFYLPVSKRDGLIVLGSKCAEIAGLDAHYPKDQYPNMLTLVFGDDMSLVAATCAPRRKVIVPPQPTH